MTDTQSQQDTIQRNCPECEQETEWERKVTAFGDGYRCECARVFIQLDDVVGKPTEENRA